MQFWGSVVVILYIFHPLRVVKYDFEEVWCCSISEVVLSVITYLNLGSQLQNLELDKMRKKHSADKLLIFLQLRSLQSGVEDFNYFLLYTPWAQDVNWTYIRRSEDILEVFWASYVRSIYVLCSGGKKLIDSLTKLLTL